MLKLLPPDHRHTAISPLEALIPDVVLEFLVPDSGANSAGKVFISGIGADDGPQVGLFGGEEAGAQLSMRIRSHVAQNDSLTGLMKPISRYRCYLIVGEYDRENALQTVRVRESAASMVPIQG